MQIRRRERSFAPRILAIINEVIATSTAIYDYVPRTGEMIDGWLGERERAGFPILAAIESGTLLGFASYGTFRPRPAYKYTVEHSVYVERSSRGRGLGTLLLAALIRNAGERGYHTLIDGIDGTNAASIALHRKFGFEQAGRIRHAGFKFGRWLDLDFYQSSSTHQQSRSTARTCRH